MGGLDKEEFPPLLPAGFHQIGADGCRRLCVDRFPNSITRPRIMGNLEAIITDINGWSINGEIWIDGSFLTEKLNPDDVDIALIIPAPVFKSLNNTQKLYFNSFRNNSYYDQYKIDNYGLVLDPNTPMGQWGYAYWLRQFGFSRANEMKGIISIPVPFLVAP